MKLPQAAIGPTDLIAYRECPRRMSYGMKRHTGQGEQSREAMPEADVAGAVWARGYGSAAHTVIELVSDGYDDEAAIAKAWKEHGHALLPEDVDLLRSDLEVYRRRDFPNTRLVLLEEEIRVPLMKHNGGQVWFRTKVDRLYQRLDAPEVFIHVDYKSSRHRKPEEEIHSDLQLWMTNWAIHEMYPECETLLQNYDQLRYGQVPTRKSADQRRQIHDFLVLQVGALLDDDDVRDDGLLVPRKNQWCPWCPIMESCPVIDELMEFGLVEIAALAPQEKVGRKIVVQAVAEKVPEYVEKIEDAKLAGKVLERFVDAVGGLVKQLPPPQQAELGYRVQTRSSTTFTPEAKQALIDNIGLEKFLEICSLSQTAIERALKDDPELKDWALGLGDKGPGPAVLMKVR